MASTITPLTDDPASTPQKADPRSSSKGTASPARGIAMGAILSAPMWIGIVYLLRLVVEAF